MSALGKRQAVTDRQRMAVSISEKICIVLPIFDGLLFDTLRRSEESLTKALACECR